MKITKEYCDRCEKFVAEGDTLNNYTLKTARIYCCTGKLPVIHVGKFVYIPKDYIRTRKRGVNKQ